MEQGERRKTNPLLAGAAFLGALMAPIGAWGQSRSSNYDGWGMTPSLVAECVRADQREWDALRRGEMPNLGNVCNGDSALSRATDEFFARQRAAETPAQRRAREERQARELKELCKLHPDNCL